MKTVVLVSFFLFHQSTFTTIFLPPYMCHFFSHPLYPLPPPSPSTSSPHLNIPDDDRIANAVEKVLSLGVPGKDEGHSSLGIWEGSKHAFWKVATQGQESILTHYVSFVHTNIESHLPQKGRPRCYTVQDLVLFECGLIPRLNCNGTETIPIVVVV